MPEAAYNSKIYGYNNTYKGDIKQNINRAGICEIYNSNSISRKYRGALVPLLFIGALLSDQLLTACGEIKNRYNIIKSSSGQTVATLELTNAGISCTNTITFTDGGITIEQRLNMPVQGQSTTTDELKDDAFENSRNQINLISDHNNICKVKMVSAPGQTKNAFHLINIVTGEPISEIIVPFSSNTPINSERN